MHQLLNMIRNINKTHKGLGPLIAINILAAKARKCILNIAPAGCGKSAATNTTYELLKPDVNRYGSITMSGLRFLTKDLAGFHGHVVIDDLGAEKSIYSRIATICTFAHLIYSHSYSKFTQMLKLQIEDFHGSAALNIQPVLMNMVVDSEDWVAVIRDKVLRYYHLIRPDKPNSFLPAVKIDYGRSLDNVEMPKTKGQLYYRLFDLGLYQWSAARTNEHIPDLLKAMAALDDRRTVNNLDHQLLYKLLKPMMLERHLTESYSFETGRTFDSNTFYILVELASFSRVTINQICVDYKVSPITAERLIKIVPDYVWIKGGKTKLVIPTEQSEKLLKLVGVFDKW